MYLIAPNPVHSSKYTARTSKIHRLRIFINVKNGLSILN